MKFTSGAYIVNVFIFNTNSAYLLGGFLFALIVTVMVMVTWMRGLGIEFDLPMVILAFLSGVFFILCILLVTLMNRIFMPKKVVAEVGKEYFFSGPVGPFEKKRYACASSRMRIADYILERIVYRVVRIDNPPERFGRDLNGFIYNNNEVFQIVEEYPFIYINYR